MSVAEWRPVVGYEDFYEVSSEGQLRSLRRNRIMKGSPNEQGYLLVSLSRDGGFKTHAIHRVVAEAFLGSRPEGLETRHLDGNNTHNAVSNLAYGTKSENQRDRRTHGTDPHLNRTECPRGHPYDEANTYFDKNGGRTCKACRRAAVARWRTQRKDR